MKHIKSMLLCLSMNYMYAVIIPSYSGWVMTDLFYLSEKDGVWGTRYNVVVK